MYINDQSPYRTNCDLLTYRDYRLDTTPISLSLHRREYALSLQKSATGTPDLLAVVRHTVQRVTGPVDESRRRGTISCAQAWQPRSNCFVKNFRSERIIWMVRPGRMVSRELMASIENRNELRTVRLKMAIYEESRMGYCSTLQ